MAVPAWVTDLIDIVLDPTSSGNWSALGGGASSLPSSGETDFYVQGDIGGTPSCMSKGAWTNALKGFVFTAGGPWTVPTDGIMLGWAVYTAVASLEDKAGGGLPTLCHW